MEGGHKERFEDTGVERRGYVCVRVRARAFLCVCVCVYSSEMI